MEQVVYLPVSLCQNPSAGTETTCPLQVGQEMVVARHLEEHLEKIRRLPYNHPWERLEITH